MSGSELLLPLTERQCVLLDQIVDDPVDGFDLHSDGDVIVELLRSMAAHWDDQR